MKTVLTIAGFDPSSGAGVTADLKVFAAHGLFGTSCITALTVQSTLGVASTHPVEPAVVRATLDHLQKDLPPAGIKIGMLATPEVVEGVASYLAGLAPTTIVLDPVISSSSGRELLSKPGIALFQEKLLPLVEWITPNLDELAILAGQPVRNREEMEVAGRMLLKSHPQLTILATGGHLEKPDDLLLLPGGEAHWLAGETVVTTSTHGTGCALSSALLCGLAEGRSPLEAALAAKRYVAEALRSSTRIGHGRGPMNHLWTLQKYRKVR
ncbi:MAG TPA: bifunctional hydroxymethylpyrimidine kinase/phosphomethylpyrimidine kinase [Granulicella sp.]